MLRKILGTARLLSLALMLAAFASRGAFAQSPTPEGTVITNTASVSWTDANTNTYTAVTASVNITVGFLAGIDVTGSATAGPASPSTGNTLSFPIQNIGNGVDTVQIPSDPTISVGGVVTITGYVYSGTPYATRALLNTALLSVQLAQNASLTVQVKYDVASNKGGVATVLTLTAASKRTPATTDSQATTITPTQAYGVAVTPDGGQSLTKLPSNGTNYSFTFTVTNTGNGTDGYSLVASHPNSAVTIVSVNGVAGSSTSISGVASGAPASIAVVYSVGNVAAGSTDNVVLTATSAGDNSQTDAGYADLTVIRPALSMAKAAYRDNQTTLLGGGDVVLPGEYIQYKVTITNNGAAAATVVQITDAMPAEVTYQSATQDAATWTFSLSGTTLTADLTGALAPAASRFIWIRVRIK
jgi:uncharacterized repeat protein (TIGR01451 family)